MSPSHALESFIDLECFVELNGSADLIESVAPLFASQAVSWLPDFESAIAQDDPAPVLHLLHKMAGCCAAICALPLARGLRDAERAVLSQGLNPHRANLQQLCKDVRQLNDAMVAYPAAKASISAVP